MILYLLSENTPLFFILAGLHIGLSFAFSFVLKSKKEDPVEGNYAKLHWSNVQYVLLFLVYLIFPIYLMEIMMVWDNRHYMTSGRLERGAEISKLELDNELNRKQAKKSMLMGIGLAIQNENFSPSDLHFFSEDMKKFRKFYNKAYYEYGYPKLEKSRLNEFIRLMADRSDNPEGLRKD